MTTPEVSWPTSSFASNKPEGSERAGINNLVIGWDGEGAGILERWACKGSGQEAAGGGTKGSRSRED